MISSLISFSNLRIFVQLTVSISNLITEPKQRDIKGWFDLKKLWKSLNVPIIQLRLDIFCLILLKNDEIGPNRFQLFSFFDEARIFKKNYW